MKKIIGSLLLLVVIATAFNQQSTTRVKDKQYYLGKSHKSIKILKKMSLYKLTQMQSIG